MYGMVNNAIRAYVSESYGKDAWATICERAGVDHEEFATMLPYDDAVSLNLLDHTSRTIGMPAESLLREIGRYWIHFAARSSFAPLIAFGGGHFEEFLGNLDAIHSKLKASLPKLEPPSFDVERRPDGTLRVHYRSVRQGLFPFVEGLFEGLAEHFGQPVEFLRFEALGPGEACWSLRVGEPMRLPAA
jgi:guanylate cyclase soluble subunit beta